MRPRGLNVHLGGPLDPILLATRQQHHAVGLTLDYVLGETLHIDPLDLILTYLQGMLGIGILKQIIKTLVVDLEKGAIEGHFHTLSLDLGIELLDTSRDQSLLLGCKEGWCNRGIYAELASISCGAPIYASS